MMNIIPVCFEKEISSSDNLADLILGNSEINDGDILVVAQKIISKHENRLIKLSSVQPSVLAEGIASQYKKDPRIVELILSESKSIVRMQNGIIIVETNSGFICANAGIDESNVAEGYATLLPEDSDFSAKKLRDAIFDKTQKNIPVIISDTFGRPFRMGQTNCAIGISGIAPILDYQGTKDSFERTLRVTAIAIVDELSSAAELVMGKTLKCPAVIIRGYNFKTEEHTIDKLIRPKQDDLFR